MRTDVFHRNVLMTVHIKAVKLGIKVASRNVQRANIVYGVVGLKHSVGGLMSSQGNAIIGMQLTQEDVDSAKMNLGEVGKYLVFLCKHLKVKLPTSTKKSKLIGTRTAAILQLDQISTDILGVAKGLFLEAPDVVQVVKDTPTDAIQGAPTSKQVESIDAVSLKAKTEEGAAKIASLLGLFIDVYWRLCLGAANVLPTEVFDDQISALKKAHPGMEFQVD